MNRSIGFFLVAFVAILISLFVWTYAVHRDGDDTPSSQRLRIMAYANFLKSWGPGLELSQEFEKRHNIDIEWVEVGNAGMIVENLMGRGPQESPDLVLGLDLLSVYEAQKQLRWKRLQIPDPHFAKEIPVKTIFNEFVPFDWAPMTFVFKRSTVPTPTRVDDLLRENYANSLALQDPRTSATGLYFLIWILSLKGEEQGFEYLRKLKPSIRIVSPSWSASYSLFQNNQAPMVFSFFTSTIYHYLNEGDYRYQPVYFDDPHIYSIEYAAVPEACRQCELATQFVEFLLEKKSQKLIMEKNFMLPAVDGVRKDTPFDFPKSIQLIDPKYYETMLNKKDQLLERWSELNL